MSHVTPLLSLKVHVRVTDFMCGQWLSFVDLIFLFQRFLKAFQPTDNWGPSDSETCKLLLNICQNFIILFFLNHFPAKQYKEYATFWQRAENFNQRKI
jgi:hypothetical protein